MNLLEKLPLKISKKKIPALRINTRGLLLAKIPKYNELLFDVINISETGFLIQPIKACPAEIAEKVLKDLLEKRSEEVEVVIFNSQDITGSLEFRAILKAVEHNNRLGFEVARKDKSRFKQLYEKVKTISITTELKEDSPGDKEEKAIEIKPDIITRLYLLSSLEEKKESIKQSRIKSRLYLLFVVFFLATGFLPALVTQYTNEMKLKNLVEKYEKTNNAKVIFLVHRKKQVGFFGFPVYEYLEVVDAHRILSELRNTSREKNILLVIHSPGGELLAAMQIAKTLKEWKGKVTVAIPYYAMSAGTLISLAADEILARRTTAFGSIDPQIPVDREKGMMVSAVDVVNSCKDNQNNHNISDRILCETGKKALKEMEFFLEKVILKEKPEDVKMNVINTLLYTQKTHDFPFFAEDLKNLGLNVKTEYQEEIDRIVDLLIRNTGSY